MTEKEMLVQMREAGFVFDGAKGFITDKTRARIAQDAAMVTPANSGVPAIYTTYIDPAVVDILTAPRNARAIFGEAKKGDWTTSHATFRAVEQVGQTTPYTDYGNGAMADVNVTYPVRQNYVGQTHIRYGVREMAVSGMAKVDLAAEKQRSAATIIDIEANRIAVYGIEGMEIYGLLNDPNLPTALTPATVNTNVTLWSGKNTQQIYNDILALFQELATNSLGRITQNSPLVFVCSPSISVELGKATEFNVSVLDMMKKYFSNIEVVVLPELSSATAGETVMLVAKEVDGAPVGEIGYSDKMRAFPMVQHTSWMEQKFAFGAYGTIIYRPYAVSSMQGV